MLDELKCPLPKSNAPMPIRIEKKVYILYVPGKVSACRFREIPEVHGTFDKNVLSVTFEKNETRLRRSTKICK